MQTEKATEPGAPVFIMVRGWSDLGFLGWGQTGQLTGVLAKGCTEIDQKGCHIKSLHLRGSAA